MGAACAGCVGDEERQNEQVDDIYGKTIEKGNHRSDNHNGYKTMPNRMQKLESSEVPE